MRSAFEKLIKNSQKRESFALQMTHRWPLELGAFFAANMEFESNYLFVCADREQAYRLKTDIEFWTPHKKVCVLDAFDPGPFSGAEIPRYQIHERLRWLSKAQWDQANTLFVATISGLLQKTIPVLSFFESHFELSKEDKIPQAFIERLHSIGYHHSPLVEDTGSYSNRGHLIDIFPLNSDYPIRIELFDEDIESLRYFDPETQRTISEVQNVVIGPAREVIQSENNFEKAESFLLKSKNPQWMALAESLRRRKFSDGFEKVLPIFYDELSLPMDFFESSPTLVFLDENQVENEASSFQSEQSAMDSSIPVDDFYESFANWREKILKAISINKLELLSNDTLTDDILKVLSGSIALPKVIKTEEKIIHLVNQVVGKFKERQIILSLNSDNLKQRIALKLKDNEIPCNNLESPRDILRDDFEKAVYFTDQSISRSLDWPSEKLTIFSEKDMLGRSRTQKDKASKHTARSLSFGEINTGDYLIHAIHGVCQFEGLQKMDLAGFAAEFLVLSFKGKDKLFLPIYRIHQIFKFSSDKASPTLDKLGGTKFSNVKTKTKRKLREIANDLVELYANRNASKRAPYKIETNDIVDFFDEFPFQETTDQLNAISDVVKDLEKPKPMDRLICGDVGFGKTEVAMRAAFVVSSQKKQVAILAPTTVLTFQHFKTLTKRFAQWPLKIEVVNRLSSNKENKAKLAKLESGEIDIIVGTHRLLSQDVKFHNLGLLVIDEEQKFGVKHKEKIKKMKINVDTLALSATPIPRTLNMSLLGIRDLSFIQTAPIERLETRTFICRYNREVIQRAVQNEVKRGGQVFFLHNRVQSIYAVADELRALLPNVKIGIGHGQLKEKDLEQVMHQFFNGEIDLLLSTTIIESGVDVPNANTILIDQAENFGLSQLYQLRGRVGRSGRRAYCYLLTSSDHLTETSKERLRVIQENTSLGSGLAIAQYDLELRGAGTLLGEEQSGVIDNLGYEYFMELMEEAILEAKGQAKKEIIEPEINLKIPAFIPDTYIANLKLRLTYYRRLSKISTTDDIFSFEEELKDQFGKVPVEVSNLFGIMLIRNLCSKLGIMDISLGRETLVLKFSQETPISHDKIIFLISLPNKKYSLSPDMRLKIRHKSIEWEKIYEEIVFIQKKAL